MTRLWQTVLALLCGSVTTLFGALAIVPTIILPNFRSDCLPGNEATLLLGRTLGVWCPASDPITNAFYLWRTSPLTELLHRTFFQDSAFTSFEFMFGTLVLFLGLWGLTRISLRTTDQTGATLFKTEATSVLTALFGALSCAVLYGHDRTAFAAISWFPLLLTAVLSARAAPSPILSPASSPFGLKLALIVLASMFLSFSANQLSLLLCASVLLFAVCLSRNCSKSSYGSLLIATATLLPALISLCLIPETPTPWYPQGSQVVPDDEIPGMLRPFFGPLPPVPFIDRWALRADYLSSFHVILIALFAALALSRRFSVSAARVLLLCGTPVALLFFDLRMPEPVSIISPLLVLPRIIPNLFFVPLEHTVIGLAALGLLIATASAHRTLGLVAAPLLGVISLLVLSTPTTEPSSTLDQAHPVSERHQLLLRSPSQFALRAHHWNALGLDRNWILEREDLIRNAHFTRVSKDSAEVTASHHPELSRLMIDGRSKTRWTAGGGSQKGGEWVSVRFSTPLKLDGVELFLGDYVTDFPRGLRVRGAETCDALGTPDSIEASGVVVVESPAWYGGLDFTAQGYPYFRGRHSMRLFFPSSEDFQCLVFEQIGESDGTDWSIAELRILESGKADIVSDADA